MLIDGTYTNDPKTNKLVYSERTPEQMEQIKKLVKTAVGFTEERGDKIEVLNMQFRFNNDFIEEDSLVKDFMHQLQGNYIELIKNFMIFLTIIVIILFFVKPFIYKILDASLGLSKKENIIVGDLPKKEQAEPKLEDEKKISKEAENKSFKSINDAVENSPDETINIIKNWLNN